MPVLILYTRAGCCLCEGLEERLRALLPPGALHLVDVDGDPVLRARYGLSVPVVALAAGGEAASGKAAEADRAAGGSQGEPMPLPPVPPRLKGEQLLAWLRRHAAI
ncbi:MAG: glutaredoxin family protein [Cyanobacteriota bacterium]